MVGAVISCSPSRLKCLVYDEIVDTQVVPGSTLPSLTPKTKPGLASAAGEAPAQELAASACQSSVGCFGFLARDDGSDEEDTIKAGVVPDVTGQPSPDLGIQAQDHTSSAHSVVSCSQPLRAESIEPRDSGHRLKESTSIGPHVAPSHLERSSSSLPPDPCAGPAGKQGSLQPSNGSGNSVPGSRPFMSNSSKARAITAMPNFQRAQIMQHQESQQGIQPPVLQPGRKRFRWPSAPWKQMFKTHMDASPALAASHPATQVNVRKAACCRKVMTGHQAQKAAVAASDGLSHCSFRS